MVLVLALAIIAGSSGCATGSAKAEAAVQAGAKSLIQADRQFCALAKERGVAEAFRAFAAEDGTCFPMGEAPVRGRSAIFALMSSGPKGELTWTPVAADVARSSDLGYTWGTYEFRGPVADGQPLVRHGKYVTIWKKQPDGAWKFVVDIGNPGPPPQ